MKRSLVALALLVGVGLGGGVACNLDPVSPAVVDGAVVEGTVYRCEYWEDYGDGGITQCHCDLVGPRPDAPVEVRRPNETTPHGDPEAGGWMSCSSESTFVATALADEGGHYSVKLEPGYYHFDHDEYCGGHDFSGRMACVKVPSAGLNLDMDPCLGIVCLPNLYLRPDRAIDVLITITPGHGAEILTEAPPFDLGTSWRVRAEPDGELDLTEQGYLFYEAFAGRPPELDRGWDVRGSRFAAWATETLPRLGWPDRAQEDFITAWEDRFVTIPVLRIHLLPRAWVDGRIALELLPDLGQVERHWFFVLPHSSALPGPISEPVLPAVAPVTPAVLEWGVILGR